MLDATSSRVRMRALTGLGHRLTVHGGGAAAPQRGQTTPRSRRIRGINHLDFAAERLGPVAQRVFKTRQAA